MNKQNFSSSPKVSIVMPSYNSAPCIAQAIDSVIRQDFSDWELLIVDDASDDGTPDLVRSRYLHDPRISIHVLSQNQGAAIARNTAIERARGRFIAFLDSDDYWFPEKLESQVPALETSDACLAFSQYKIMQGDDETSAVIANAPLNLHYADLLRGNPIGCLTAIYDTKKTGKVFMPLVRRRQDWGLWLRLLRGGQRAIGLQKPLAVLRIRKGSLSANKVRSTMANYRLLRTEGQLDPARAIWGATLHALSAINRRWNR